ncbi:MAG: nucleotidyltransferase domain-containing protein [Candidatus Omnitrophica bacterium]|nr:nucleotidyltransferase domain-containing protein [Candidatus Omnitrophota bacterium]MCM8810916.1 nucleotidyltransferase domain-containing protein [Candidatus Omnitrophota bacterium]
MKRNIEKIIQLIVKKLVEKYDPEKVILFGSYAYGNPTEDSDIDILIIKNTDKKRRVDRFVEVKRLLYNPDFYIPISPIVLTNQEVKERLEIGDDFIEEILTKGKIVYEK